jgi:WD40 repeat protein
MVLRNFPRFSPVVKITLSVVDIAIVIVFINGLVNGCTTINLTATTQTEVKPDNRGQVAMATRMPPQAQEEADPEAYRLAAQALLVMDNSGTGLVRSTLLSIESLRRAPTLEGDQALRQGLALLPPAPTLEKSPGGWVSDLAFSPTQPSWVAAASENGIVPVWEADTGRAVVRLAHRQGRVSTVAFSSDGRLLATGGSDQMVRVWDVSTGREIARMKHESAVHALTFSPDGQWLATTSWDGTAWVWASTGRQIIRIDQEEYGPVSDITFSPDGQWLAIGLGNFIAGEVQLWRVGNWQQVAQLGNGRPVRSVAFSPDGHQLAASEFDVVQVWDVMTRQEVAQMAVSSAAGPVAFSPGGLYLAVGSWDEVELLEPATGRRRARLVHEGTINALAFSPTANWLATASEDHTVRVWDLTIAQEMFRIEHGSPVKSVAFSPDGRWLATGSADGKMRIWATSIIQPQVRSNFVAIKSAAFSPDSRWLVLGYRSTVCSNGSCPGGVKISKISYPNQGTDLDQTSAAERFDAANGAYAVAFSHDSRWLAAAVDDQDRTAWVWKMDPLHKVAELASGVSAVALSADGGQLATASGSGVQVWQVASGQEMVRIENETLVSSLAFSPDGQWLAAARADNVVLVSETTTGQEVTRLPNQGWVKAVAFSPDGRWLAVGGGREDHFQAGPGEVQIWETSAWHRIARWVLEQPVQNVVFSPDARWLAAPSLDGNAYVWEVSTGRGTTRLPHAGIRAVTFSPDSQLLVTADETPWMRGWFLQPEDLVADACARLPHNLSQAEWHQYFGDQPYHPTCPNLPVPEE